MKTIIALILALTLTDTKAGKYLSAGFETKNRWMVFVDKQHKIWSVLENDLPDSGGDLSIDFIFRIDEISQALPGGFWRQKIRYDPTAAPEQGILSHRKRARTRAYLFA